MPKLWPISGTSLLTTTNDIDTYTHLPSTSEMSEQIETSPTYTTIEDAVVTDFISSTLSIHVPLTTQEQPVVTDFSLLHQLDSSTTLDTTIIDSIVDVTTTLHSSSPLVLSSTTLFPHIATNYHHFIPY